jgi:hypothetical protein
MMRLVRQARRRQECSWITRRMEITEKREITMGASMVPLDHRCS